MDGEGEPFWAFVGGRGRGGGRGGGGDESLDVELSAGQMAARSSLFCGLWREVSREGVGAGFASESRNEEAG